MNLPPSHITLQSNFAQQHIFNSILKRTHIYVKANEIYTGICIAENSQAFQTIYCLTLFIPGFLDCCSTLGGGGGGEAAPPTPYNSSVFKSRRLKFCTELFRSRTNILKQEKRDQNRYRRNFDVIFALMSIENC